MEAHSSTGAITLRSCFADYAKPVCRDHFGPILCLFMLVKYLHAIVIALSPLLCSRALLITLDLYSCS
jgi:hypothetical protein